MTDKQIGELINSVENAEKPIKGAEKWVNENQELINEWTKE